VWRIGGEYAISGIDDLPPYQQVACTAIELCVNVGLFDAAFSSRADDDDVPQEFMDNWHVYLAELRRRLEREIGDLMHFGEAFDSP